MTGRRALWAPIARLVGRRLLASLPVLAAVTFGVFAVAAASPFDPVQQYAGSAGLSASQETLDQLRRNLNADGPFPQRWWDWLTGALSGDFGDSTALRQPVTQVIGERLGWSVLLCAVGFAFALLAGTVLGVAAARRRGGPLDRAVTSVSYTLEAAPPFWLGLLGIWLFAVQLGVLLALRADRHRQRRRHRRLAGPPSGAARAGARHLTGAVVPAVRAPGRRRRAGGGRGARRAGQGLAERTVLLGHALRSGLLPVLTLVGSRVPELITGALLVETVFSWPGIASATVEAATAADFPLLAALTTLATAAVLAGNLLSDLLYGLADPRVAWEEM